MGNNTIELIRKSLEEIKQLVYKGDYKNSYTIYIDIYNKLIGEESEDGLNYLLSSVKSPDNRLIFSTIIENLKNTDKIRFLFHLIYENILIESVDIEENESEEDKAKEKNSNLSYREQEKEKIVNKINKILRLENFIKFAYFKSYLYELLAEKYYILANMNYYDFIQEHKDSLDEIQIIIDQYNQCRDNYNNSKNYKKKIEIYESAYNKAVEYKKLLIACQKYKEKNYIEALNCFNEIKSNESKMIEEKENGIYLCNEKLGEQEKENENYEKALEYFTKSKNNYQIFQLKLLINEKKIINCIKEKKYEDSFIFFIDIFTSYNNAKISYDEKKYSDIFSIFIELMIKLSLIYCEQKNIQKFKESIKDTINHIANKETKMQIEELIIELNNIELIDNNEQYQTCIHVLNSKNKSEVKQRFYLSLLMQKYFKEKTLDLSKLLLKENINLNYISVDAFTIIKNIFKEKKVDNKEELLLLSKIIYKIIVGLNKFNKLDCLALIGEKIKELNKIPGLENIYELNDVMENLLYSFQEIMINNKNIKSYDNYKNLFLLVITKNKSFINCITNGLLFLSEKKIIIEKKYLTKLNEYLLKNENNSLLQILLLQFKLQPLILKDDISLIYNILFFYQKLINSNESQTKIFEFLLTLSIDIISSKNSILNLEKYSNEGNIVPKFFDLVEKIPLNTRGIYLSQQLLNYNEKKMKQIIKIDKLSLKKQLSFKLYFQKEDLPLVEKNLEDPKIFEKLIYSLKQQKYLFNELNIENITKNFSSSKKELFNLLIENRVNFNEKSLINLLQGFYKDNYFELRETFNIFYKIKEYEALPEIININLKIEEFLNNKEYLKMDNINNQILEISNNFSYLFGFSSQHENFILFILDLPSHSNIQTIINITIDLLIKKHYDIGIKIFKKIILSLDKDKFIELSKKVLSNNNIPINIKNQTIQLLYSIIKSDKTDEYKIKIFSSFKYFVDKIKIPDILLKYLIAYLKNEGNDKDNIKKEIILFLGIYFSTAKSKQEKFLNELKNIYGNNVTYQFIINNIKTISSPNHIFYLFSNLYYYNYSLDEKNEEKILSLPKNYLIDFIKLNFGNLITENFEANITYMENYFKFGKFSPKRDAILRNLFFHGDQYAVNNLRLICH